MAKIYLGDSGSDDIIIGNSNTVVYGTGSTKDSITLNSGINNVTIQSNVELVTLVDNISDYKFAQGFGSNLGIYDSSDNLIGTLTSVDGKILTIEGKEFNIDYTDGVVSIEGNKLSDTPTVIDGSSSTDYTIKDDGITLASDDREEIFSVVSGSNYTHKINNFDIYSDKLDFGDEITADNLVLTNTADDGKVLISYSPDMGSTTVNIELTGLSLKDDSFLTTKEGLNSILNGYTPPPSTSTTDDIVNGVSVGDASDDYISSPTMVEFTDSLELKVDGHSQAKEDGTTDTDSYSFVANSSGTLSLDLYNMSSDLDIFLLDKDSNTVGSSLNYGDTAESISFNVTAKEQYTIVVNSIEDTPDSSYNIYGWIKEDSSETAKYNDYIYSFDDEKFISVGNAGDTSDPLNINLHEGSNDAYLYGFADDIDSYSFSATQNGTLVVSLYGMDDNLDLGLFNSKGESIASSTNLGTDEDYILYDVHEGEVYTVGIVPNEAVESSYDMSIYIA